MDGSQVIGLNGIEAFPLALEEWEEWLRGQAFGFVRFNCHLDKLSSFDSLD